MQYDLSFDRGCINQNAILLSFYRKSSLYFDVLSNPKFLAEGSVIKPLENPVRILMGRLGFGGTFSYLQ
ncbi:MAG: hypothetical protein K8R40_09140 [Anaerolineaceae bacterium]|nr:hypothetical protein [Anaerolineaceae bacterium]